MIIASWPGRLGYNPFIELLAQGLQSAGSALVPVERPSDGILQEADALVIQWPDQVFWHAKPGDIPLAAAIRELEALMAWRWAGKKLVWIVHNRDPHDLSDVLRRLWRLFANALGSIVDGYMTLSPATRALVIETHPSLNARPYGYFRHPAYPSVQRSAEAAATRRRALGIARGEILLGAVGMVGTYKGLPELIDSFRDLKGGKYRLLIAGKPKTPAIVAAVQSAATGDRRIVLHLNAMTDDEYAETVAACDLLVAPYRDYLHSGVLIYAPSAERRILTPETPFALDVASCVGEGWIHTYRGKLEAATLQTFLDTSAPADAPNLRQFDAATAGRDIVSFIDRLHGRLARSPQHPATRSSLHLSS